MHGLPLFLPKPKVEFIRLPQWHADGGARTFRTYGPSVVFQHFGTYCPTTLAFGIGAASCIISQELTRTQAIRFHPPIGNASDRSLHLPSNADG